MNKYNIIIMKLRNSYFYNQILIVLIFFVFGLGCSKYKNITYHFSSFSLNHLDNTGASQTVSYSDSIIAEAYGIRLNLNPVIDSETDNSFSTEKSTVINSNTITSIYISSKDSFDVNSPPGTCLNKKFV